jgi:hypothetical protein
MSCLHVERLDSEHIRRSAAKVGERIGGSRRGRDTDIVPEKLIARRFAAVIVSPHERQRGGGRVPE